MIPSNRPSKPKAVLSASLNVPGTTVGATIRCEKGTIDIDPTIPRPVGYTIKYHKEEGKEKKEDVRKDYKYEGLGFGWHFQADEVARCVWQGKKESELWGHQKSLVAMHVFDEVRKQIGYVLPPGVEKVL